MTTERLIVLARWPEAGRCKTRTIPALGPDGAATLQRIFTHRVLDQARRLASRRPIGIEVRFTGGSTEAMRALYGDDLSYREQGTGDLGDRLIRASSEAFVEGASRVVMIGTDSPDVDERALERAFARLEKGNAAAVVIGPAADGGYWLIGSNERCDTLFREIRWSSSDVLRDTRRQAAIASRRVTLLETLPDVDEPDDLLVCRRHGDAFAELFGDESPDRLSIIVPTRNEEASIRGTVESLTADSRCEAIVVDGGSEDGTARAARDAGARVIEMAGPRSRRLNAGAAVATGSTLLFLHADCRLPDRFVDAIFRTLQSGAIGGAFRLEVDDPRPIYRRIERFTAWRCRWWGRPYGDQGLFVRADRFRELGGFRPWPLMEDYEFVGRMRRAGRVVLRDEGIVASARRWQRLGPWRTTLTNQAIVAAYHLGVSPERLAAWYRR
ncbi:MAG TPA: TIGR04283 family arsenosugar biosynthesis glycosyltransferase [Pirellulaceae bacterium]|nr:TIGR04283 family arsenosugar biosynthesis glycosyltransferase [Pirellulaceae bacterium]